MKLLKFFLIEGRKEDLKKKYSDKYDEEDLDFILGISDLQDFNHKYTDWVLKHLLEYADVIEVAEIAVRLVKDFDKYQKNLEKKDINQYLSFEELDKALFPLKVKEQERALEAQTEKIYEDDNFLVLIPKTQEASCKYGAGTKWCVTQKETDHFQRYTSGRQQLYFILRKKGNKTEPHYKIAVHTNELGTETWWDALDRTMNTDSINLFKEYFPELVSAIKTHGDEKRKKELKDLDEFFKTINRSVGGYQDYMRSGKPLIIEAKGFDRIPDIPGKAMGLLKISFDNELIDAYDMYLSYSVKNSQSWNASIGFDAYNEFGDDEFKPKYDFKFWEGWGIDETFGFGSSINPCITLLERIVKTVYRKISSDFGFEKYVKDIQGPVWRPDRHNYGYTFGKNKGLIKKLVDYLDGGYDNGTKLDFLEYIGKLKSKVVDGKKQYSHSNSNVYHPSSQWRGHFASFFASAKNAGIIQYTKDGSKFIIKPGPNFDAFKKGELKAL